MILDLALRGTTWVFAPAQVAPPIDVPTGASDQVMWWLVLGFFSVWVIKLITNWSASPQAKAALAFAFCLLVGFLDSFFRGGLTVGNLVSSTLTVLLSAILFYNLWFKALVP